MGAGRRLEAAKACIRSILEEAYRGRDREHARAGTPITIVDSESGFVRVGPGREMARILGADYHRLEEG
jgi:Mg-chelatase subunit ChlD